MGKKSGGSVSIISEEHIKLIEQAVKLGCYIETAAAYAGIHKAVFYEWLKRGAKDKQNRKNTLFVKFHERIEKALAESELRDLKSIDDAANGLNGTRKDWKAAAWKLERRSPKRWAQKSVHKLETDDGETSFSNNAIQDHIVKILKQKEEEVANFLKNEQEEE